jgi:hypothetical protein
MIDEDNSWICEHTECRWNIWHKEKEIITTSKSEQIHGCIKLIHSEWTFQEIAEIMGISKQRVQQIEVHIFKKLSKRDLTLLHNIYKAQLTVHQDVFKVDGKWVSIKAFVPRWKYKRTFGTEL